MLERLASVAPKVCELLEQAEDDLTAFYVLPPEHWTKLRSTNPLGKPWEADAEAVQCWSVALSRCGRGSAVEDGDVGVENLEVCSV